MEKTLAIKQESGDANRLKARLPISRAQFAAFCQKHGIRKLSVFGSVLRPDFSPNSDIDVLVEFLPCQVVGLRFITIQEELAGLLRRRVDLVTPNFLNRRIRQRVLSEAEVQYEQG